MTAENILLVIIAAAFILFTVLPWHDTRKR